jgi:phasin family protein
VSDPIGQVAAKTKRVRKPALVEGTAATFVAETLPPVAAEPIAAADHEQTEAHGAPVEQLVEAAPAVPAPAPIAETIEAVTSPALQSDSIAAAETAFKEGTETMATIAPPTTPTDGVDKAQAFFGDATQRFKTAFDKSSKLGEEMVELAKGNVEAMVASARVAAKAGESLGQEAADYGKRQFEGATAAFKSFAGVKSPTELFQLQSDYAKASFDSAVAEASRLSETMLKVAGEIVQPLSNRYAVAAEKIKAATL